MDAAALDTALDHIFDDLTAIPAFPKTVNDALRILDDPGSTTTQVGKVIRFDPILTANILKAANSAYFGLPRQVSSVETALALLGTRQVREILIMAASRPYLDREIYGYGMRQHDLWAHSLGCAALSEVVARHSGFASSDLLFTSALLHDIGKYVMNEHVGVRAEEIQLQARVNALTFTEAEWRVLGTDHAILGSEVLRLWEFPREIVRAVRKHHDPDLYIQDDLSSLLAFSNILTVSLGFGVGLDGFRHRISPELPQKLGLTASGLAAIIQESFAAWQSLATLLA